MALFKHVVEAFVASRELDQASLSRLTFWVEVLGDKEVAAITADDIDAALLKLAERGRLKAGKRTTTASGTPLAGSTINRHLSQAGSVFKHAKRLKLVRRTFIPPTRGIERAPVAHRYRFPHGVARGLDPARPRSGSGLGRRHAHHPAHEKRRPHHGRTLERGHRGNTAPAKGRRRRVFGNRSGRPYTYRPTRRPTWLVIPA
jgi:hypothetical protein